MPPSWRTASLPSPSSSTTAGSPLGAGPTSSGMTAAATPPPVRPATTAGPESVERSPSGARVSGSRTSSPPSGVAARTRPVSGSTATITGRETRVERRKAGVLVEGCEQVGPRVRGVVQRDAGDGEEQGRVGVVGTQRLGPEPTRIGSERLRFRPARCRHRERPGGHGHHEQGRHCDQAPAQATVERARSRRPCSSVARCSAAASPAEASRKSRSASVRVGRARAAHCAARASRTPRYSSLVGRSSAAQLSAATARCASCAGRRCRRPTRSAAAARPPPATRGRSRRSHRRR